VKSLPTNVAENRRVPKSSVKIVWHEPVDIPTSSAGSRTVRSSDLEVENRPDRLH
jgi:hypothetical protein